MKRLLIISVIILVSCDKDLPSHQSLVEQYYNNKVSGLMERKNDDCMESILLDAQHDLDSLFDRYVNTELFDSTAFPVRPERPTAPDHIIDRVKKFEHKKED